MPIAFSDDSANYYKVRGSELPEITEDTWTFGAYFYLNNNLDHSLSVVQLGRDTDQARVSIAYDLDEDQLSIKASDYSWSLPGAGANIRDKWVFTLIQKTTSGAKLFTSIFGHPDPLEQGDELDESGIYPWYALLNPTGLDLFVGVGHDGTAFHSPLDGMVGEVFLIQGSADLDDWDLARMNHGTQHALESVDSENVLFYFNFSTADDIEYDISNQIPAVKYGSIEAVGRNPYVQNYRDRGSELLPRLPEPSGYELSLDKIPTNLLTEDSWSFGIMFYLPVDEYTTRDICLISTGEESLPFQHIHIRYRRASDDDSGHDSLIIQRAADGQNYYVQTVANLVFGGWNYAQISYSEPDDPYLWEAYHCTVEAVPAIATLASNYKDDDVKYYPKGVVLGNGPRKASDGQVHVAQCWFANDVALGSTEAQAIASGSNFITDYATDSEILWWYQFAEQEQVERCMIHDTHVTMFGEVTEFSHPITPVLRTEIEGTLPHLEGSWAASQTREQEISGTFSPVTGVWSGRQYETPTMEGIFPSLAGGFVAKFGNSTGDISGTFPALTGELVAGIPDKMIGTFTSFTGWIYANTQPTNYLYAVLPASAVSFVGENQGLVVRSPLLVADELIAVSMGKALMERLVVAGISTQSYVGLAAVLEQAVVKSTSLLIQNAGWLDQATIDVAQSVWSDLHTSVTQALEVVTSLVNNQVSTKNLLETAEVLSNFFTSYLQVIQEALLIGTVNTSQMTLSQMLTASLEATILEQGYRAVASLLTEALSAGDAQTVLQHISSELTESLHAQFYIDLDGESYLATVFNTETDAMWTYENYGFNSFSGTLAAKEDGIYHIGGADDAGDDIDAEFETGYEDLGTGALKRLAGGGVYLGIANDGSVRVKVTTSRNGTVEDDWYEEDLNLDAYDTARISTHDGLASHYWKFTVANHEGSHINLDTLHMYPVILTRQMR